MEDKLAEENIQQYQTKFVEQDYFSIDAFSKIIALIMGISPEELHERSLAKQGQQIDVSAGVFCYNYLVITELEKADDNDNSEQKHHSRYNYGKNGLVNINSKGGMVANPSDQPTTGNDAETTYKNPDSG